MNDFIVLFQDRGYRKKGMGVDEKGWYEKNNQDVVLTSEKYRCM